MFNAKPVFRFLIKDRTQIHFNTVKNHPSLVAEKVLEIAESNCWQLRYPVGPVALPFLQWRASMTDEEYVNWHAATDEDWYNAVQNTFGLNARQE